MSTQQILISEISQQPEPMLREVLNYLRYLKAKSSQEPSTPPALIRDGFGSVPGIVIADDFDAPLAEFADYRP